jgi:hypothetical protein
MGCFDLTVQYTNSRRLSNITLGALGRFARRDILLTNSGAGDVDFGLVFQ